MGNKAARNLIDLWQVKKETFTVAQILEKKQKIWTEITASGNVNEATTLVTSIAQVLNEEKSEEKSEEDVKEKQKVHTSAMTFYNPERERLELSN